METVSKSKIAEEAQKAIHMYLEIDKQLTEQGMYSMAACALQCRDAIKELCASLGVELK